MFMNHLKVALRNILKQRAYNSLNAIGLATGIACGLIIALYIKEELSYEKSFPGYNNIYRAHTNEWAKSSPPLAERLGEFFPEIEKIGRFSFNGTHAVNAEGENAIECTGYYADSTILDVFDFDVLEGERTQALVTKGSVVITKSMARKLFGESNAVGKTITFDSNRDITVNAVMEDPPQNSHLRFDYLIPIKERDWGPSRGWMCMYTYAKFKSAESYEKASGRMTDFIKSFFHDASAEEINELVSKREIRLQPLKDIHLKSSNEQEMGPNGSMINVYIFMAVEALILIVACANFMSLFTTQAIKRMKEVGMRKILGAKPKQLMWQFFVEVILLAIFSFVLAIIMYQAVLPLYNSIGGKTLQPWQIFERDNMMIIASILLVIIATSGLYPAIFIARFKSASFLREGSLPKSFPNLVRSGLVVFQFMISTILIASTIIVNQQMKLLQNKALGFDKDQVVYIRLYGNLYQQATKNGLIFKNELMKDPAVLGVGLVSNSIGDDLSVESIIPKGKESEEFPSVRLERVDNGYLQVLGVPLVAGRYFTQDYNDSASYIINETAARVLRLDNPVGQAITNSSMGNETGTIVGVVKDFHFQSLHNAIEPLVLEYRPEWTSYLTVKIRAGKVSETLSSLRSKIGTMAPNTLFVYSFLDQRLDALYKDESNLAAVFQFFAVLAIIIACLGLVSLSAYTIESRTKEIGVRKVLGATVTGLISLLSSRFFRLVLIAFFLGAPVTFYFMNGWLAHFAYQIDIQWWVFLVTAIIIVVVTLIVVGFHTVRAALMNPVKSLRYE